MKTEFNSDGFKKATAAAKQPLGDMGANDLFTDAFIKSHTRFATLQEMVDASGLESPNLFETQEWADFAAANSDFPSWQKMAQTAAAERFKRSFGA